jgi:hypothetical protein
MRDDEYRDNIRHADQSRSRPADGTVWPTPSKSGTSTPHPSYMRYLTGATLPISPYRRVILFSARIRA